MKLKVVELVSLLLELVCFVGTSVSQECGGVLTEPYGDIKSPGYPDSYPPNVNCHWEIHAPATRKIILTFIDFLIEESVDCFSGDYLAVSDPEGEQKEFCGQDHPWTIESIGNTLSITFNSDSDDQQGFRFYLAYVTVSKCGEGWQEFGEHCYYFSDVEMTFDQAQVDCETRNAQLTSVHSREEQLFVQERAQTPTVWIGATNTGDLSVNPLDFEFLDGTPTDYHNAWQYEVWTPLHSCRGGGCGILLVPDRWANRDCSETRPVICESTVDLGEDWHCWEVEMNMYCFHVSNQSFTFSKALSHCEDSGAAILSIGGDEINHMCVALILQYDERFPHPLPKWTEFWIGLRLDVTEEWTWLDGSPFQVDRWEEGYPTDDGGECVVMTTSSWDELRKSEHASYVCKKSP
ncbi:unnamed protein product [Darwinula stevensoni]|uniref:Uncharacterized protein n=1 Tax=Darwinula stevensoni TaxID=69355 RepID=A0A7R9FRW4_9CRUS|nr:unnamed protein product [Darwinula stevensoni]CAG0902061.1 unnamed protein product [Darwinula stevensoni]